MAGLVSLDKKCDRSKKLERKMEDMKYIWSITMIGCLDVLHDT